MLAGLPDTSIVGGSIHASALHLQSLHVLPVLWGFPPGTQVSSVTTKTSDWHL